MVQMLKTIPPMSMFMKLPLNLFFVMGLIIRRWKPTEKNIYLQAAFVIHFIFMAIINVPTMAAYFVLGYAKTSLELAAYVIYVAYLGNAFFKWVFCLLNVEKIRAALDNFDKYYPKTWQEREDYKLDEHLKRIRKYILSLTIYHFTVTTMFNLFPLIQTIYLYYESEEREFKYILPYTMVYPFDVKNGMGYAFAYITQCLGCYILSCAFLSGDLLLISCVHLINMNFTYLNKIIMEFKPSGTLEDLKAMRRFIIYHIDILDTVELIDETFNFSIFLSYAVSGTMICLIGFQIIAGSTALDLIKFQSFLVTVLTHVFFISLFANEMMTLSSDISEAFAYHSWHDAHIYYKRSLPIAIARAQRPAELHAYKYFIISMETFKSLVSVSYQFFTLIKARYEET